MPRLIVQTDPRDGAPPVATLVERVIPEHIEDDLGAHQLVERIGWALCDAREAEQAPGPEQLPLEPLVPAGAESERHMVAA